MKTALCICLFLLLCASVLPSQSQQYDEYEEQPEQQEEQQQEVYEPEPVQPASDIEGIARCMADKGVVMYGSAECGHTQRQMGMFDGYFGHIPFVDCRRNRKECREVGVGPYPHWVFPSGEVIGGQEVDPTELAVYAGCSPEAARVEPETTTTLITPKSATKQPKPLPQKTKIRKTEYTESEDVGFENFRGY